MNDNGADDNPVDWKKVAELLNQSLPSTSIDLFSSRDVTSITASPKVGRLKRDKKRYKIAKKNRKKNRK